MMTTLSAHIFDFTVTSAGSELCLFSLWLVKAVFALSLGYIPFGFLNIPCRFRVWRLFCLWSSAAWAAFLWVKVLVPIQPALPTWEGSLVPCLPVQHPHHPSAAWPGTAHSPASSGIPSNTPWAMTESWCHHTGADDGLANTSAGAKKALEFRSLFRHCVVPEG